MSDHKASVVLWVFTDKM